MKRWDLRSLVPSSRKQRAREPGADAPRVPRPGKQMPRVLFTSPECRAIVIELRGGEELGDHYVRERAVVEVVSGRISVEASGETVDCESGKPSNRRSRGAPHRACPRPMHDYCCCWSPGLRRKHNTQAEKGRDQHLPVNAVTDPIPPRHDRRNG